MGPAHRGERGRWPPSMVMPFGRRSWGFFEGDRASEAMRVGICSVAYCIWLHLQFVREHEQDLQAEQRIQIMMTQIQRVDVIVIAPPYWDLSFPAVLKAYLENIYVTGLVSEYGADGMPHGLCLAKNYIM